MEWTPNNLHRSSIRFRDTNSSNLFSTTKRRKESHLLFFISVDIKIVHTENRMSYSKYPKEMIPKYARPKAGSEVDNSSWMIAEATCKWKKLTRITASIPPPPYFSGTVGANRHNSPAFLWIQGSLYVAYLYNSILNISFSLYSMAWGSTSFTTNSFTLL